MKLLETDAMWYLQWRSCTLFHTASSVPRVAQVFHATSIPAGEKEAVGDRLCPSLPGLDVTIPPLRKVPQQNGWSGLVGEVCGSWEGACGGAGAQEKG